MKSIEDIIKEVREANHYYQTYHMYLADKDIIEVAKIYASQFQEGGEVELMKEKLQKCYTEIWKNTVYPLSMSGKPKPDDILKKEFEWLK